MPFINLDGPRTVANKAFVVVPGAFSLQFGVGSMIRPYYIPAFVAYRHSDVPCPLTHEFIKSSPKAHLTFHPVLKDQLLHPVLDPLAADAAGAAAVAASKAVASAGTNSNARWGFEESYFPIENMNRDEQRLLGLLRSAPPYILGEDVLHLPSWAPYYVVPIIDGYGRLLLDGGIEAASSRLELLLTEAYQVIMHAVQMKPTLLPIATTVDSGDQSKEQSAAPTAAPSPPDTRNATPVPQEEKTPAQTGGNRCTVLPLDQLTFVLAVSPDLSGITGQNFLDLNINNIHYNDDEVPSLSGAPNSGSEFARERTEIRLWARVAFKRLHCAKFVVDSKARMALIGGCAAQAGGCVLQMDYEGMTATSMEDGIIIPWSVVSSPVGVKRCAELFWRFIYEAASTETPSLANQTGEQRREVEFLHLETSDQVPEGGILEHTVKILLSLSPLAFHSTLLSIFYKSAALSTDSPQWVRVSAEIPPEALEKAVVVPRCQAQLSPAGLAVMIALSIPDMLLINFGSGIQTAIGPMGGDHQVPLIAALTHPGDSVKVICTRTGSDVIASMDLEEAIKTHESAEMLPGSARPAPDLLQSGICTCEGWESFVPQRFIQLMAKRDARSRSKSKAASAAVSSAVSQAATPSELTEEAAPKKKGKGAAPGPVQNAASLRYARMKAIAEQFQPPRPEALVVSPYTGPADLIHASIIRMLAVTLASGASQMRLFDAFKNVYVSIINCGDLCDTPRFSLQVEEQLVKGEFGSLMAELQNTDVRTGPRRLMDINVTDQKSQDIQDSFRQAGTVIWRGGAILAASGSLDTLSESSSDYQRWGNYVLHEVCPSRW